MTFIQLEYIVALDTWRHFAMAADQMFCYTTHAQHANTEIRV